MTNQPQLIEFFGLDDPVSEEFMRCGQSEGCTPADIKITWQCPVMAVRMPRKVHVYHLGRPERPMLMVTHPRGSKVHVDAKGVQWHPQDPQQFPFKVVEVIKVPHAKQQRERDDQTSR